MKSGKINGGFFETIDPEGELESLSDCRLCPRECGVNRLGGEKGWCRLSHGWHIASIGPHHGEEPVISGQHGICNVFFSHCNLQCIYCQNYQISCHSDHYRKTVLTFDRVMDRIRASLQSGCHAVGFVTPSHMIPYMRIIMKVLRQEGNPPAFVYNSNGYDSVNTLRSLEGEIDVYLPDMKYWDSQLAASYSGAPDYPEKARLALIEMYRQKGSSLITDAHGQAVSGLIIRHLVLPGQTDQSISILRFIAEELSPRVHLSLMSQYYPVHQAKGHPELGRKLYQHEYERVVEEMHRLGFQRGWVQGFESPDHYLPDFNKEIPFEPGQ